MLRKKRGVVGSAKSRSHLDQPILTPFLLQQQGASRMSIANTMMEGQLPLNSFQDEIERHAVTNQTAGSLFPQQTEVMQVDGALKKSRLVLADFAFTGNMQGMIDGFIDIGKESWEKQLHNEIGKVERVVMMKSEFKDFLNHDFAFSNVSPAIDLMSTMLGSESVQAPTPDEVATLSARIRSHDPTLLTDVRALIKILKSPELWTVLYDEVKKYAIKTAVTAIGVKIGEFLQYLIAQLRRVGKDYGLPIPPWFDSPPPPDGGDGGFPPPAPPPPAPPADPTAPPSVQRPNTADTADPTLETEAAPQTGTVMPPTPPTAPTPVVMPPTTPTTGMGLHYHPRNPGAPPPPPPMPTSAPSPLQNGDYVAPQYTSYYMVALQYMLVTSAAGYGAFRFFVRPAQPPPPALAIEHAIEGGAQHGLGGLPRYLIINFAPQMFNSNLFRYIVENLRQGDPFFWHVRFTEWARTLFQQAIVNGQANEPMFPDPGEVPPAQIDAVQAGQRFLQYYEGLGITDQSVIDAVKKFLDTMVQQNIQNIVAEQQPYDVEGGGQTVGEMKRQPSDTSDTRASQASTTRSVAVNPFELVNKLGVFSDNYVTGGIIATPLGLREGVNILIQYVMNLPGLSSTTAVKLALSIAVNPESLGSASGARDNLYQAIEFLAEYLRGNKSRLEDFDTQESAGRPGEKWKSVSFVTRVLAAMRAQYTKLYSGSGGRP
jgi:hypothetical protein